MKLYRIGELAKLAGLSERTVDYYTKLGLIEPESRSLKNYRLYGFETLSRLERITKLKKDKYTLEEIKEKLNAWDRVTDEEQVTQRLTELELHMLQLQREVRELEPLLQQMKPNQAKRAFVNLIPQSAACIEALKFLLGQGSGLM
ncbi:MerR family transcriptional regulator [Paenibacillus wulumuqiensis]|uniref:MerR family transcriptional regulator n=1 Tax=Paenibacillus wulumuqiensis TaxID=1567107 RepID=UPI0006198C30|nr:MerR family transcriptional regulator [Paenibacillus wulumuqiensis]